MILPFVTLNFYEGETSAAVANFLVVNLAVWLILNIIFFCSIDLGYMHTFTSTVTAPQYNCELFLTAEEDSTKFKAAFKKHLSYTKNIKSDVKEWVANNVERWIKVSKRANL